MRLVLTTCTIAFLLAVAALAYRWAGRRVGTAALPVIDLNRRRTRRALVSVCTIGMLGAVTATVSSIKILEFADSNVFCGETCHSVMAPEYTAFRRSPHSGVHCVDCHVGPGLGGFIQSKINGSKELAALVLGTYETPITAPVHNLPDPSGTCLTCHTAEAWHGVATKVITRFDEDEDNTETKTVLLLNVGGSDYTGFEGIHQHTDPDMTIRYRSDPTRTSIYEVEVTRGDGSITTYHGQGLEDDGVSAWRTMDCIDCHNRPTHNYLDAARAVDLALERASIPGDLPFVKREGMRAVRVDYASHDAARTGIAADIEAFYRAAHPAVMEERPDDVMQAGRALGDVYAANVFPSMQIDWGTYPDHRGHEASPGCFRCHAGNHATDAGKVISADCRICHTILAWDETDPEILAMIRERERGAGTARRTAR
jgi:nitrate/TMAO reductase-like tetraheme cytochrome c subunit